MVQSLLGSKEAMLAPSPGRAGDGGPAESAGPGPIPAELLGQDLAHPLAADPLLDPPVGIVGLVDVGYGLAFTGEVVELPLFDRLADAVLGDQRGGSAGGT